jgi:ubiquinone/menaquinone biosynthesis C-methylase UbiE
MVNLTDVMQAYDDRYAREGFKNNESYYRWALDVLSPKPGESLLDIACGMGDLLHYAARRQTRPFGIDLSPVAVSMARKRSPSAKVMIGNAQSLPFGDSTFDHVTILGSLEHFLDPGRGLLEIRRVLKWGGRALILVPNAYYLPDIIWQVWRTGYGPNHKQVVERFATAQEWRAFIESGGLAVSRIRRFNFQRPRTRGDWEWYRANPRRLLGLIAAPFIPFNLSHSFLYLCEKDPASRCQDFDPPFWPIPPRLVDLG